MEKFKKLQNLIAHEREYVAFLKKRLDSEHFRASVTKEEIETTQRKYDKAKLKLRMMEKGWTT